MFDSIHDAPSSSSKEVVVVAMSGGIDSSLVAAYLKIQGYNVIGITMRLYDEENAGLKTKSCCAGRDIQDAEKVARDFNFPHYVVDRRSTFRKEVIEKFMQAYTSGNTPIPCIACNQTVKFRDLLEISQSIGADYLATGHYIRKKIDKTGEITLHKAVDEKKDQSYFMFSIQKEILSFLRFPLGVLRKSETRSLARKIGLSCADKKESQDICFVQGKSYKNFIKENSDQNEKGGLIIDKKGKILRNHEGISHFTIGQRRGIKISSTDPLYVIAIDKKSKNILVGTKSDLLAKEVHLKELNWLVADSSIVDGMQVEVKLRSSQEPLPAIIKESSTNTALILLKNIAPKTAPGQACVIYKDSMLIGGGWIKANH